MADITGGTPCPECGGTDWNINEDREYVSCEDCGHSSADDPELIHDVGGEDDMEDGSSYED